MKLEITRARQEKHDAGGLTVSALISNDGRDEIELDLNIVESASLSLQLVDSKGKQVPLVPPPVPMPPRLLGMAPGEQHQVVYSHFLASQLGVGAYQVRLRHHVAGKAVTSPWFSFRQHLG